MKVLILALIICSSLFSSEFFIDGKKTSLISKILSGKYPSVISKECTYKNSCLALKALGKIKAIKIKITPQEGLSVGNQVCRKYLDGKINYARDTKGNELNLCEFKDGSMIDLGSITP